MSRRLAFPFLLTGVFPEYVTASPKIRVYLLSARVQCLQPYQGLISFHCLWSVLHRRSSVQEEQVRHTLQAKRASKRHSHIGARSVKCSVAMFVVKTIGVRHSCSHKAKCQRKKAISESNSVYVGCMASRLFPWPCVRRGRTGSSVLLEADVTIDRRPRQPAASPHYEAQLGVFRRPR